MVGPGLLPNFVVAIVLSSFQTCILDSPDGYGLQEHYGMCGTNETQPSETQAECASHCDSYDGWTCVGFGWNAKDFTCHLYQDASSCGENDSLQWFVKVPTARPVDGFKVYVCQYVAEVLQAISSFSYQYDLNRYGRLEQVEGVQVGSYLYCPLVDLRNPTCMPILKISGGKVVGYFATKSGYRYFGRVRVDGDGTLVFIVSNKSFYTNERGREFRLDLRTSRIETRESCLGLFLDGSPACLERNSDGQCKQQTSSCLNYPLYNCFCDSADDAKCEAGAQHGSAQYVTTTGPESTGGGNSDGTQLGTSASLGVPFCSLHAGVILIAAAIGMYHNLIKLK